MHEEGTRAILAPQDSEAALAGSGWGRAVAGFKMSGRTGEFWLCVRVCSV